MCFLKASGSTEGSGFALSPKGNPGHRRVKFPRFDVPEGAERPDADGFEPERCSMYAKRADKVSREEPRNYGERDGSDHDAGTHAVECPEALPAILVAYLP